MEYKFKVSSKDYYKSILTILNFNLRLSNLELDIVSTLLLDGIEEINTSTRDTIRKRLNKGKYNTNNYIIRLKNKGIFLEKTDGTIYLNPTIRDIVKDTKVSFNFEIHDNNN